MRKAAAVISGYVSWTVLWLGGNAGLRASRLLPGDATQPISAPLPLLTLLVLSLACSLLAGYVAVLLLRSFSTSIPLVLAFLLFATGCFVQSSLWHLMPIWYHLAFLGLLIPVTLLGGRVSRTRN
jgi:hypothetical protein